MKLRAPQAAALSKFAEMMDSLNTPLSECSPEELKVSFSLTQKGLSFKGPCPELTFELATGVGKTRLIGAIIAYLYLSGDSQNFLILTPRSQIIRKFLEELRPSSRKYIFVDSTLVGTPMIISERSLGAFSLSQDSIHFGPTIWVFTPQAFAAKQSRLKTFDEQGGASIAGHLKSRRDLVVFIDESHHLGSEAKSAESVWRRETRSLCPKIVMGTTATTVEGQKENILYQYTLSQAINDRLYTKDVRVIVQTKSDLISEEDADRNTLRYGLARLAVKRTEMSKLLTRDPRLAKCRPVMLVSCQEKSHAEATYQWLISELGSPDKVLLVHSGLGEDDYKERLDSLESEGSQVEVVVNVTMLSEGWDVANVYVIAPLRAMASPTIIAQVMGRGLRLPFGERVKDEEVDTLDVLCFGKDTMVSIVDNLKSQGFGQTGGVSVVDVTGTPDRKELRQTKEHYLKTKVPGDFVEFPVFKLILPLLDLSEVRLPPLLPQEISAVKLHDTSSVFSFGSTPSTDRTAFVSSVCAKILGQCKFLSTTAHSEPVCRVVSSLLDDSGFKGLSVELNHEMVASHVSKALREMHKALEPNYRLSSRAKVEIDGFKVFVPLDTDKPIAAFDISAPDVWRAKGCERRPFTGWARSKFTECVFDEYNEFYLSKVIDRDSSVKWWIRNMPGIITLDTPAGRYSPDFAVVLEVDGLNVLLEVKGEVFAAASNGDATVKRESAEAWCRAATIATATNWQHWFILSSDTLKCQNIQDIRSRAIIA